MRRSSRFVSLGLLLGAALLVGGCPARLAPAPTAELVDPPERAAAAEAAGVRVVARVDAWRAMPPDLDAKVMPLLVTIENESAAPLRLRYDDFAFVGPDEERFAALPPFDVEGTVRHPVAVAPYPRFGFGVAPHLGPFFPGHPVTRHAFPFDYPYWALHHPTFVRLRLPTADMVQLALPEGVVEPQGRVAGFLYFERVPRAVGRVDFTMQLVSARTTEPFETVTIPFVLR